MMDNENKERKREQNWSRHEKDCLRELINSHLSIVESKVNDLKMIRKKKEAWEVIRMDMLASGFDRNVAKIKQQWVRMKVGAKKAIAEVRRATVATGNVAKIPKLDEGDLQIETMLEYEFLEDSILIDSDTITPLPVSSRSPSPLLKSKGDDVRTSTPLSIGKKKLLSRLRSLKKSGTKADVIRDRQEQIQRESAHEDDVHSLKVEKIRAEIAQQAEVHQLKIVHMKELHALKCELIRRQNGVEDSF